MIIRVSEIFHSIQGEAKYLGCPTVFVRLAGCDIGCAWCDTDYTAREELSRDDLVNRIRGLYYPGCMVSLTGGEPLLQAGALEGILPFLKKEGMPVFLETNGILYEAFSRVASGIDIVAMDFKLPTSTGCRAFWAEHREMLERARGKDVFVKIVVTVQTSLDEMRGAVDIIASVDPEIPLYLQPNTAEITLGAMERSMMMQKMCLGFLKDVRVVPQVHRLAGVR